MAVSAEHPSPVAVTAVRGSATLENVSRRMRSAVSPVRWSDPHVAIPAELRVTMEAAPASLVPPRSRSPVSAAEDRRPCRALTTTSLSCPPRSWPRRWQT